MGKGRCYGVGYTLGSRKNRRMSLLTRDGPALAYLTYAAAVLGYRFEGTIINCPGVGPELQTFDDVDFREDDLLILPTRPPVDDVKLGDKRAIRRSFTTLEETLFRGPVNRWLDICARSQIVLSTEAASVSTEIGRRGNMMFFQNGGASYKNYGWRGCTDRDRIFFESRQRLTPAFLIYAEHAWPGGPGFLAAFGMGASETIGWCRALVKRFPDLLCTTPFVMAEMRTKPLPARPTVTFSDSWDIEILGVANRPSPDDASPSTPSTPVAGTHGGMEHGGAD
jgi:hypothetical protein